MIWESPTFEIKVGERCEKARHLRSKLGDQWIHSSGICWSCLVQYIWAIHFGGHDYVWGIAIARGSKVAILLFFLSVCVTHLQQIRSLLGVSCKCVALFDIVQTCPNLLKPQSFKSKQWWIFNNPEISELPCVVLKGTPVRFLMVYPEKKYEDSLVWLIVFFLQQWSCWAKSI